MNRDIPFDEKATCDGCGKLGAFDFMGDYYCEECIKKELDPPAATETPTRTVLPEALKNELIIKSAFGLMIRGFNGMGFDARLGDVLTDVQPTPQAAIDALAAQIAGKDKQLDAKEKT